MLVIYSVKLFSASLLRSLSNCIYASFLFLTLTFVFTVNPRADPAIPERGGLYTAGLEIISGESPDTMTGQIHFSSVTYRFWPFKLYKIFNS